MNNLERGGVSWLGCDIADDFMHLLRGEHRGERQVAPNGDNAVPAGRTAKRRFRGPHARHPDGDTWRLDRARQELRFLDMISSPFVAVGLAAPKPREHLKALVQQRRQRFGGRSFAHRLESDINVPLTYPKQPPT